MWEKNGRLHGAIGQGTTSHARNGASDGIATAIGTVGARGGLARPALGPRVAASRQVESEDGMGGGERGKEDNR